MFETKGKIEKRGENIYEARFMLGKTNVKNWYQAVKRSVLDLQGNQNVRHVDH